MNKNSLYAIIIMAIVVLVLGYMILNEEKITREKTINANGIATIKTMPDQVSVIIRIETTASSADEAKNKNSEISENVMNSLLKLIDKKDIQTEYYNIYPEYDWSDGRQTLKNYKATNTLRVNIKNFDNIGKVVDAAIDSGANGIDYINFELSEDKKSELKKEALEKASRDAREKAEAVAKGLNAKIGNIITVTTSDYGYIPFPIYRAGEEIALEKAVTNIQPKELEATANVQVVFELK